MTLNSNLKNIFLVIFTTLILSACSTAKKSADIEGDVYTGKETVEYLASGVPDRVRTWWLALRRGFPLARERDGRSRVGMGCVALGLTTHSYPLPRRREPMFLSLM